MKYLVFSDTHFTAKFNDNRFRTLASLILDPEIDRVIINGDFWDGYRCDFQDFLDSEWQRLFPFLLQKQCLYIYGNHDAKKFSDDRVSRFSVESCERKRLKIGYYTYDIFHGHQVAPTLDVSFPWLFGNRPSITISNVACRLAFKFFKYTSCVRHHAKLFEYARTRKDYIITLCAHTHFQCNDFMNEYINNGVFDFGYSEYVIISDGYIEAFSVGR